jgi:glycosyltransferase involved in cell wall biosynthesis
MRILVIIPSYKPAFHYGGPIRSVASLCEAMGREGHHVTVITTKANGKVELEVEAGKIYNIDNVNVYYFTRWTKDHTHLSPALLKDLYKHAKKYDIVHIHSWWNLVTMPATMICLLQGIRPVLSPRGSITQYTIDHQKSTIKRLVHFILGKRLLERVTIHSTSPREDQQVSQLIKNKRRYIIPNILELPAFKLDFHENAPFLRLAYLGRIDRVKNLEFLLAELTSNVKVPYQLTIAGEGESVYVDSLKKIGMPSKNIVWAGHVDGDEKFKLLAQADLLVLPSHTENFGNVVIEALSQGTPVLISDNVGAKDYVLKNELGWVVPTTPGKWADVINAIWKNKSDLIPLRLKAKTIINKDFNQSNQVEAYLSMYRDNFNRFHTSMNPAQN